MKYIIREIENNDFYKNYLELMYEFSGFSCHINYEQFVNYLKNNNNVKIIVIENIDEKKIIGSGTIFMFNKIHNNLNKMGFIQDVIIDEAYRKMGFGSMIVNKLIEMGHKNCYKIILNCNINNIPFYEKNKFTKKGIEMEIRP